MNCKFTYSLIFVRKKLVKRCRNLSFMGTKDPLNILCHSISAHLNKVSVHKALNPVKLLSSSIWLPDLPKTQGEEQKQHTFRFREAMCRERKILAAPQGF